MRELWWNDRKQLEGARRQSLDTFFANRSLAKSAGFGSFGGLANGTRGASGVHGLQALAEIEDTSQVKTTQPVSEISR
jgi:hypothetical protein